MSTELQQLSRSYALPEDRDRVNCQLCGKLVPSCLTWDIWLIRDLHSDSRIFGLRGKSKVCARCTNSARGKGYEPILEPRGRLLEMAHRFQRAA